MVAFDVIVVVDKIDVVFVEFTTGVVVFTTVDEIAVGKAVVP